ncbi:MAG: hypothetical protein K2K27_02445, partial [Muribaculaceae bacterium]|nr:hypothetical protein [Muribaculaceae bacterium]
LIGRRCRGGNVYSRAILITRTLSGELIPPKKTRAEKLEKKSVKVQRQKANRLRKRRCDDEKENTGKQNLLPLPVKSSTLYDEVARQH